MPEPEPAKTKMSMDMNSATAALAVSGWDSSPGAPTAILLTGIFQESEETEEEPLVPALSHTHSQSLESLDSATPALSAPCVLVMSVIYRPGSLAGEPAGAGHDRFKPLFCFCSAPSIFIIVEMLWTQLFRSPARFFSSFYSAHLGFSHVCKENYDRWLSLEMDAENLHTRTKKRG